MATSHYKGSADIIYDPPDASETVHVLAVPILISPRQGFTARSRTQRFEAWTPTLTEREVFTLTDPVYEIEGWIRMDDQYDSLETMLEYALNDDVTLRYRPDGATEYPMKILSAGGDNGEVVITPDTERFAFGEWQARIVGRRVDGSSFSGLF